MLLFPSYSYCQCIYIDDVIRKIYLPEEDTLYVENREMKYSFIKTRKKENDNEICFIDKKAFEETLQRKNVYDVSFDVMSINPREITLKLKVVIISKGSGDMVYRVASRYDERLVRLIYDKKNKNWEYQKTLKILWQ